MKWLSCEWEPPVHIEFIFVQFNTVEALKGFACKKILQKIILLFLL